MTATWQSTATGRAPAVLRTTLLLTGSRVTEAWDTATTASVHRGRTSASGCTDPVSVGGNKRAHNGVHGSKSVLVSSGATQAPQYCYDYNAKGSYWGFCKRFSLDKYIPCQQE